jgi:hypothetical protein
MKLYDLNRWSSSDRAGRLLRSLPEQEGLYRFLVFELIESRPFGDQGDDISEQSDVRDSVGCGAALRPDMAVTGVLGGGLIVVLVAAGHGLRGGIGFGGRVAQVEHLWGDGQQQHKDAAQFN